MPSWLECCSIRAPLLPRFRRMLRSVSSCQGELEELKATMQLLDAWKAPEPSPYFLTRLGARMREEREAAPAGWLAGPSRACALPWPMGLDCMCVRWRL